MSTTTTIEAPLSFTEGAKIELKKLIEQQEIAPDFGLRVGVEGGGCAGMNYILGFDQEKEGDQEFNIDGIRVLMNKAHGLYLAGMTTPETSSSCPFIVNLATSPPSLSNSCAALKMFPRAI